MNPFSTLTSNDYGSQKALLAAPFLCLIPLDGIQEDSMQSIRWKLNIPTTSLADTPTLQLLYLNSQFQI